VAAQQLLHWLLLMQHQLAWQQLSMQARSVHYQQHMQTAQAPSYTKSPLSSSSLPRSPTTRQLTAGGSRQQQLPLLMQQL
jgi:hypothetical protein